jgi:hypothetical protein
MSIGQIVVWIIVGGFWGTLTGRVVILKKEGLGRSQRIEWLGELVDEPLCGS